MPYVTSFEEFAREEGLAEGRQQGRVIKAKKILLTVLRTRFPADAESLAAAINALSDEARFDALLVPAVPAASFEEFRVRFTTP